MKNVENVCNANFLEKMKNVKIQPNLPDCPPPSHLHISLYELRRGHPWIIVSYKNKNISSRDEVVNVLKRQQRNSRNEIPRNIFNIYLFEMIYFEYSEICSKYIFSRWYRKRSKVSKKYSKANPERELLKRAQLLLSWRWLTDYILRYIYQDQEQKSSLGI